MDPAGFARSARVTTGAEIVAKALADGGASHAFGIPGGEVLALLDGFRNAGVRFVLAKHENPAGFMAEGFWHVSGDLPVLVATLGPGVANAINVVANAMQDRVPLIFITGCVDQALAESYTHQVFDHQAVLRPVVKASFRIAPGAERLVVEKAIAIATSGRPGPVHIDLPISVAEARVDALPAPPPAIKPIVTAADFSACAALLAGARRPLVIAGLDVVTEGASAALQAFVRRIGAPVLTTYKAKGVISEDDPAVIGAVGLSPKADAIVRPLIEAADLIVLAGYDPIEMRAGWRHLWPAGKKVIDLVAQDMQHGMHHSTVIVEGRVEAALQALSASATPAETWPDGLPAATRTKMQAAFAPGENWGPQAAFDILRRVTPRNTVVTADSGAHRILLSQMWDCYEPRTLLQSSGLCTMGCALPLAIGSAMAARAHTLCIVGDAGLEMVLGELATARDLGVSVVIAVLVDASLGLIELKQRQSQLANTGVDFGETDFPAVARAMGGHGVLVENAKKLECEAEAAFQRPGVSLLACKIERRAYDGLF